MSAAPSTALEASPHDALLEALIGAGKIDVAGARRAIDVARTTRELPIAILHQLALIDDASVVEAASRLFGVPLWRREMAPAEAIAIDGLSTAFLRRRRLLPLARTEEGLIVGLVDPTAADALAALAFAARCPVEPRLMPIGDWREHFAALYGEEQEAEPSAEIAPLATAWTDDAARVRDHADATPAVRLVDALLDRALEAGASDIHVEPMPDRVRIRFRVDGDLTIVAEEPPQLAAAIAARIKILADMDVANRRAPQDGRTSLAARGRPIDVRISTIPSTFGETVAMRLLRRDPELLDLARLGFSPRVAQILERVILLRRGIFLVTGPTGSGKTTTLYAMIERLRVHALKILSIEDPIEYFFRDVTQTQVNEDAGLSFATALRAFLRQDPDVILVGEIRDAETARIAMQAALTGHLVLSTLHTNDAASAVPRLVDMGLDRYLVSATLSGVMSQRLVPRACSECRAPREATVGERALLGGLGQTPPAAIMEARGCPSCRNTGRRGRVAVAEAFLVSDAIRATMADPGGQALTTALRADGFASLYADGARRVLEGETSLADITALGQT